MADPFKKKPDLSQKLLLTEKEAAEMLSVSIRTLYSLRKSGRIPYVKFGKGGRPRYWRKDLEKFIEENRCVQPVETK